MMRILFVVATVALLGLAGYVQLEQNSYSGHSNAQLDTLEAELRRVDAERALTEEELGSYATLTTERRRRLLLPWIFAGAVLTACGAAFAPGPGKTLGEDPTTEDGEVRKV